MFLKMRMVLGPETADLAWRCSIASPVSSAHNFSSESRGWSYRDLQLWKGTLLCFHSFRVEIRGSLVPTADSSLAHCTLHSQSTEQGVWLYTLISVRRKGHTDLLVTKRKLTMWTGELAQGVRVLVSPKDSRSSPGFHTVEERTNLHRPLLSHCDMFISTICINTK